MTEARCSTGPAGLTGFAAYPRVVDAPRDAAAGPAPEGRGSGTPPPFPGTHPVLSCQDLSCLWH